MPSLDQRGLIALDERREVIKEPLEVVVLGGIEPRKNELEQMAVVKFGGKIDHGTWLGVFLREEEQEEWQSWLGESGYGAVVQAGIEGLPAEKRERLAQLANTNLPPIFIFHLALNKDIDLDPIVEKFGGLNHGPSIMGVASEQSGQGKTTISIIHAARSEAVYAAATMFAEEGGAVAVDSLKAADWDKFDVDTAIKVIEESRSLIRENPRSLSMVLDDLWEVWSTIPPYLMMLVDLPGVHVENGKKSRLLDGADLLHFALPSYMVRGDKVQDKPGFDASHHAANTHSFLDSIGKIFRLDEGRMECLRDMFRRQRARSQVYLK